MEKTILLNQKFYPLEAINQTKEAFAHLCQVRFVEAEGTLSEENSPGVVNHSLAFTFSQGVDEEIILREFCNYCLGLTKGMGF